MNGKKEKKNKEKKEDLDEEGCVINAEKEEVCNFYVL